MLTGYLAEKGVMAGQKRVGSVLREIHQPYHQARCNVSRQHFKHQFGMYIQPLDYHDLDERESSLTTTTSWQTTVPNSHSMFINRLGYNKLMVFHYLS